LLNKKIIWNFPLLSFIPPLKDITINVKSLKRMLLVSGYGTPASLITIWANLPKLFTHFTTPKPISTLLQSIVKLSAKKWSLKTQETTLQCKSNNLL
jgi:hypothetical protein